VANIPLELPNLDRPINIPENFPEDAKKIAIEKTETLSSQLKENSNYFDGWLDLAIYRKMLNDYDAAREIWEYLAKVNPKNSVVFHNLGDLYAYFLKDTQKAEENFLKALENGPDQIYIYRNVYEFYRYAMKDDVKAKQILEQGIKANPGNSQDLQNLLNNF
jgi:tetratricopeptide (TPR) repeat protein